MRILLGTVAILAAAACGKPDEVRIGAATRVAATETTRVETTVTKTAETAVKTAVKPVKLALTCAPPFTPDATAATLMAAFGPENVIPETIDGPEGEKLNVTAIYPTDPTKRIEVSFKDEEARTGLVTVVVKNDESAWTGPAGLKMGDTLQTTEAANGGVYEVAGFGWDYGGYVTNWKGGKLGETAPGCHTMLRFRRDASNTDKSLMGEKARPSDLPALRAAKPTVTEFGIRW